MKSQIAMKKMLIQCAVLSSLITLTGGCNSGNDATSATIDKEQIKKEIQEKENQFADLYNKGEMKSIGYFAEDAISFSQNKPALVGKEAILSYLKIGLDSNNNKISFTTNEVFVSSDGKQVVETGYYKLADNSGQQINSGNYMVLFEKRDGNYVCVRDMSASDLPVE